MIHYPHTDVKQDVLDEARARYNMLLEDEEVEADDPIARFSFSTITGLQNLAMDGFQWMHCDFTDCYVESFGLCTIEDCTFVNTNVRWSEVYFSGRRAYGKGVYVLKRHDGTFEIKAGCFHGSYSAFLDKVNAHYRHLYHVHLLCKDEDGVLAKNLDVHEIKEHQTIYGYTVIKQDERNLAEVYKDIVDKLMRELS